MEDALKIALAFVLGALVMLVAVNLIYNNPAASNLVSPSYCPMMGNSQKGAGGNYCPMMGENASSCGH